MYEKIQTRKETALKVDVHNQAIVKKRDTFRFDRRFQWLVHNDLQICDQKLTILSQLKFEIPKIKS